MSTVTAFDDAAIFTLETKQRVKVAHGKIGNSNSSLLKIHTDIQTLFSGTAPKSAKLSLTEAVGCCKEHYLMELSGHSLSVTVTSHNATDTVFNKVKQPDTVNAINKMVASIDREVKEHYKYNMQMFILGAFRHHADSCVFQADTEEGEWHVALHDSANRTHVEIQIFATAPVTELKPMLVSETA